MQETLKQRPNKQIMIPQLVVSHSSCSTSHLYLWLTLLIDSGIISISPNVEGFPPVLDNLRVVGFMLFV
jgi:hypothetical protein